MPPSPLPDSKHDQRHLALFLQTNKNTFCLQSTCTTPIRRRWVVSPRLVVVGHSEMGSPNSSSSGEYHSTGMLWQLANRYLTACSFLPGLFQHTNSIAGVWTDIGSTIANSASTPIPPHHGSRNTHRKNAMVASLLLTPFSVEGACPAA